MKIAQHCSYRGAEAGSASRWSPSDSGPSTDWWDWSVWLDGSDEELDELEHVKWILHPTFVDPVRLVKNRATRFRLDATGWGEFTIYARVKYKDGREEKLGRELQLTYPDGTRTTA